VDYKNSRAIRSASNKIRPLEGEQRRLIRGAGSFAGMVEFADGKARDSQAMEKPSRSRRGRDHPQNAVSQLLRLIQKTGPVSIRQILALDETANWATTQIRLYRLLKDEKVVREKIGQTFVYSEA